MTARHFALIPAAGYSLRMGEPKLLMPLAGRPLILHTIDAWLKSKIDRLAVVIRRDDSALADLLQTVATSAALDIVAPALPPPDMKASLQAALVHVVQNYSPTDEDAFLVAPADMPRLSPAIINRLIDHHTSGSTHVILLPTLNGRRGHPVLFPWPFAANVHALEPNTGLNTIVDRNQFTPVPCEDLVPTNEYPFADVDTPQDYQKMTNDH